LRSDTDVSSDTFCAVFILVIHQSLQILEPSKELAMQLMELGKQHPPTRKLGLDMLRERSLHHDYVAALLQDGYYLEALRYARKYRVPIYLYLLFNRVIYVGAIKKDVSYLHAIKKFGDTSMP
jgi:hypothetical protein